MITLKWGPLFLVPQNWDQDSETADDEIRHVFEDGRGHIKVAIEIWKLIDTARAKRISDLSLLPFTRTPRVFRVSEIVEMLGLLDGIEKRLIDAGLIDEEWHIPPERLEELRSRLPMLDLSNDPGHSGRAGIAEGISRVIVLRGILQTAVDEDLLVMYN